MAYKKKDPRVVFLKREIAGLKLAIKDAKDPEEKAFRQKQLAKDEAELAKYLQNKHPEK